MHPGAAMQDPLTSRNFGRLVLGCIKADFSFCLSFLCSGRSSKISKYLFQNNSHCSAVFRMLCVFHTFAMAPPNLAQFRPKMLVSYLEVLENIYNFCQMRRVPHKNWYKIFSNFETKLHLLTGGGENERSSLTISNAVHGERERRPSFLWYSRERRF